MHVFIQIQSFRRKPKKLKSLFSRNKQRSKDIKHLTTASEIKSCQGHLVEKHKPQEMITQYACNKPASWPLNIRLSAAKTRFTQSKFRMLNVLHCVVLVTFAREKNEREPLFKQTLEVTFHIITSLWVVFGLSTLILTLKIRPRARWTVRKNEIGEKDYQRGERKSKFVALPRPRLFASKITWPPREPSRFNIRDWKHISSSKTNYKTNYFQLEYY